MNFRTSLAASVSAAVVLSGALAAPGWAQEVTEDTNARRLGTVTVTAQRVEESQQDVPVAITVLNTAQLEDKQVQDILDLQAHIPNINVATNTGTASAARIFLRGVGEDESRGAVDQAVGIYVDGVYIGRSVGSLFDVVDLAGIEVLRGPQGTLYGRNTIGGAIKLTSVKPQFENGGESRVTIGNNGRYDLRGTGNLALGERTGFRLTGLLRERDGFHDVIPNGPIASQRRDGVGALHVLSARGSLYHEFDADWNVLIAVDHTLDRSDPIPDSVAPGNDADGNIFTIEPIPGSTCPATGGFLGFPIGCFNTYDQRLQATGLSAKVEGRLGGLDFTSITGYRELEDNLFTRIGNPYRQATDQSQLSQEFTLASTGDGPLGWLAGFYYWNEDSVLDTVFVFPFSVGVETQSTAIFGQATYALTDRLNATGGLRYTDETKDLDARRLVAPGGATFTAGGVTFARNESTDFENLSYSIGADYRFNEQVLGYAKYATGFKSGGWSPDAFGATAIFLPVREETLDSFEAGIKSDLTDRVRLNAAAFFNKYEDLQIGATVPGLGFTRFNVEGAEISGLELEGVWQVSDNFQINGNLGLLSAEYTELTIPSAGGLTNNGASPACGGVVSIQCALGLELKNAPEYKATLGAVYTLPVAGGTFILSGDVTFEDDSWSLVANAPAHALIDAPTLVNLRGKYEADAGWSVALWAKNATDEEYYRASSAGSFTTYASEPLTYGIDLGYRF